MIPQLSSVIKVTVTKAATLEAQHARTASQDVIRGLTLMEAAPKPTPAHVRTAAVTLFSSAGVKGALRACAAHN